MEGDASLWHPMCAEPVAHGHAYSCINRQHVGQQVLCKGDVGRVFRDAFAGHGLDTSLCVRSTARYGYLACVVVEVKAQCGRGSLPCLQCLVEEDAEAVVHTMEMPWVVDEVIAVTIIGSEASVCFVVGVVECDTTFSTCYVWVIYVVRLRVAEAWIDRVIADEDHQGVVGTEVPVLIELVANFGIKVLLSEVEILLCAVCHVIA